MKLFKIVDRTRLKNISKRGTKKKKINLYLKLLFVGRKRSTRQDDYTKDREEELFHKYSVTGWCIFPLFFLFGFEFIKSNIFKRFLCHLLVEVTVFEPQTIYSLTSK